MQEVVKVAEQVRRLVLAEIAPLCEDVDTTTFSGLCAIVSTCLCDALQRLGYDAVLVHGEYERPRCEHCWVVVGAFIVDATATQFGATEAVRIFPEEDGSKYLECGRGEEALEAVYPWGDQSPQEHEEAIKGIASRVTGSCVDSI